VRIDGAAVSRGLMLLKISSRFFRAKDQLGAELPCPRQRATLPPIRFSAVGRIIT